MLRMRDYGVFMEYRKILNVRPDKYIYGGCSWWGLGLYPPSGKLQEYLHKQTTKTPTRIHRKVGFSCRWEVNHTNQIITHWKSEYLPIGTKLDSTTVLRTEPNLEQASSGLKGRT